MTGRDDVTKRAVEIRVHRVGQGTIRDPMPSVYDRFTLVSDFELAGDQSRAIAELTEGLERGDPHQVLLGVTGSGKTFTMAQTIARVNRPTLVMVHNKTLATMITSRRSKSDRVADSRMRSISSLIVASFSMYESVAGT